MRHGRLVLLDGRSVLIRHLRAADREMYRDAVAGLSQRSRYLRFAAPLHTLSEPLLDRMMDADGARHAVYTALTDDESSIVGVGRFVRSPDRLPSAEVAIAVADAWQGAGLGSALLARLVERARRAELHRLIAVTLSENRAARRLAQSAGFSLAASRYIYTDYELALKGLAERSRACA